MTLDPDDLSEEQMLALLQNVEDRRRQGDITTVAVKKSDEPAFHFPRLSTGSLVKSNITIGQHGAVLPRKQEADVADTHDKPLGFRRVEDPVLVRRRKAESKKATAGEKWYNLPKTDLTPALKRDLQILKMRNVLDPHRHYKKEGGKMQVPEFSQVGTIIEGPTEFYSGRLENRQRKRTFVEEVLAGEQETGRFKRKYGDVQTKKTSGKKAFYQALKAKRSASYKKR